MYKSFLSLSLLLCGLLSTESVRAQDMLASTFGGDIYELDSVTGESSFVANCGFTFIGTQARSLSGTIYAISRPGNAMNQLITIDANGNGTLIGPVNIGEIISSIAYSDAENLIFAVTAFGDLYKIEPATGTAGLVGATGLTLCDGASFRPGGSLFVWSNTTTTGARGLYVVDENSGLATQILSSLKALNWLSHDDDNKLFGGGGSGTVYILDSPIVESYDSVYSPSTLVNASFTAARAPFTQGCNGNSGTPGVCTDCPCNNNSPTLSVGGCVHSDGGSARLLPRGGASLSAGDLRFELTSAKSNSFAMLLSGASIAPTNPVNPCFGQDSGIQSPTLDGIRCAVQDLRRHGSRMTDGNGQVGFINNGWGPPSPPTGGIGVDAGFSHGQTRHFQVFFRDMQHGACSTNINTTQVVSVTFTF